VSRTNEDGFTLVELLVSLAITGAVAGLLVAALGTAGSVAGRMEGRAAAGETVAAAQGILRDRIERLLADADGTGGADQTVTAGTATAFTFVAPAALNRPGAGMQRYYLALGAGRRLALAAVDAQEKTASPDRWRIDPLLGDVAALDIAYYGPAADLDGAGSRWQANWLHRADPPTLVRIRVRFGEDDPRQWPDLVIRPAATTSTACALDFNTGACRAS
jgi:general secretion pathway protein J